jgi:signal transduction histidine kinase
MAVPARKEPPRKAEYRVRFNERGETIGASLHSGLGESLGIALGPDERIHIEQYLDRLGHLSSELPDRLRVSVRGLLQDRQEFGHSGDFYAGGRNHHLHITGHILSGYGGEVVYSLLFLDDTEHTEQRRLYEYMFRLANHELRGPLSCVSGAVEFAEEHVRAGNLDGVKTCLDMIARNAAVLEEMVSLYLNLSRIESGSITLSPGDVLFTERVLNPVVADLQPALHVKKMHVHFKHEGGEEPRLWADPEALVIVTRNLLSNAIKYGDVASNIVVLLSEKDGVARVTVVNEGPTISADDQQKLFEKFTRLDSAAGTKGAGLGLYNAKMTVAYWGGQISVRSADGETAFTFTVPRRPE